MERLTGVSDLAVHGTVESIHSERDGDRIYTYVEVRPAEIVKGLALPAVTLRLYGGVYENTRTKVVGGPCMAVGEEVFLFLKANGESTFDVVNLSEGKFRVLRPVGQEARVERDLSDIRYVNGTSGVPVPETLAGLKAAVRAAAEGVRR